MPARSRRIVVAVTADISLSLLTGIPERLVREGWDVHVVAGGGERLAILDATPGVTTHTLPMSRDPDPWGDARALVRWLRLLRHLRPEVILVGTPKAGLLGTLAGFFTRVPIRIYHVRGLRLETTTGFTRRVLTVLEKAALRCATTALCVSQSLAERLVELRLTSADRVVVLGRGSSNGVDTARFAPGPAPAVTGLDPSVPVVGFVGRLNHDKGLDILAAASGILEHDGVDHQLLIVGGMDGSDLEAFQDFRRTPVVTGQVADVAAYYPTMRVLCLPTRREGFPNVVLEASSSATAVVTTDATGAVDSVEDGVTGIIVPVGDAQSLARALTRLVQDDDLARRMGLAGRELVLAEFSRDRVQDALCAFLDDLREVAVTRG
ncbi:glycosyltransferase family 4 protein [Microbacterium sp. Root180]|uniref:glycosyltransferase family 4 protein n=1 Tax=Microbacterium sp. Root180 TaxID=1736483 RepID=UPI0006FE6C1C|nr:glycosyltransferase family 4 protein [Microbacterium sp. Root180]KRB36252.1 hypothetical protein ASD93_09140 [Microbacterium sp. Root180]